MTEFLTVLAAVDDSAAATDAVRLAAALVDTSAGDRLFAAHAAPPIPEAVEAVLFPYACFGDDYDALRAELVKGSARQVARRLRDVLPGPAGELLKVAQGPPLEALLEIIATLGPDIVVVGPGNHAGGAARHVGSVAAGLARRLPASVAFARPVGDQPVSIQRIICAIDLGPDSLSLLVKAIHLAHRLGAVVQPVFVVPTVADADHGDVIGEQDRAVAGKVRKNVGARWSQIESQLELPFPIDTADPRPWRKQIVTTGDPGPKLVEIATETEADLVIVGRCRSGDSGQRIGRVAEYVVRHAPSHVLVFEPSGEEAAGA